VQIRPFNASDWTDLWAILEPVFRDGTTYALNRDISESAAQEFWTGSERETWLAIEDGVLVGSYLLRQNQEGGGSHVCNCGYVTSVAHRGRGIARRLCEHSQVRALEAGFLAMQFNFVVATNEGAIRLWNKLGFEEVGRLPHAFDHPELGLVDALVMFKWLKT
jgi:ribosomal protein S18 acetylase RimI-like enzyme